MYKMSANLLDLWKIGSKRKPDSSIKEHPNNMKVKNMKLNSKIPTNMEKKNFPGLNLTRRRKKCSALCAASI